MIERHGGTIIVQRTPQQRTRFSFTLPVQTGKRQLEKPCMKVLIADDDRDLLDLIAFTLSQAGFLAGQGGGWHRRAGALCQ